MKRLLKSDTKNQRAVNILLLIVGIALIVAVFYILSHFGIGIPCIFNLITKLNCPGCGNTRAAMALLRFDFVEALSFNLLFPLEFLYIFWVFSLSSLRYIKDGIFSYKTPHIAIDITVMVVVLIWTVVRNILGI